MGDPALESVYRAPMRSRELDVPQGPGARFGLEHGVVGIGPGEGEKAERMLHRFAALPEGALVWTRDEQGLFWLGRIAGPLRSDRSPAARRVGIPHVRDTDWLDRPLTEDEVPPAVAATFARGGRNLQRIHDVEAERGAAALWGLRSNA